MADKPVKVRSINTVLAAISDSGAHGAIGRTKAKAIRAALDAAGFEITPKPAVKPVEVKRVDPAKPAGMYVPPQMRPAGHESETVPR